MAIRSVEYLQSLVRELAKLPDETEWVEFKCNNKQPQMIGEYISALSNSAALCERPKAYLVWGVDDATHKIVGTEFQYRKMKKGNEELEAWLSRMLSPRINFRFFEVPMDEGIVVLIEIPCAEKQPVQFAGGEYIRIGTNKKNLKEYPDKERELWRTFDSTPYELRIAMGNLNEDEMVSLLDYSKYYDKLEMPIPRNRDKVLEDLQHEKFIMKKDKEETNENDDDNKQQKKHADARKVHADAEKTEDLPKNHEKGSETVNFDNQEKQARCRAQAAIWYEKEGFERIQAIRKTLESENRNRFSVNREGICSISIGKRKYRRIGILKGYPFGQTEVIREKLKKDGFITSMGCNNYLWISW